MGKINMGNIKVMGWKMSGILVKARGDPPGVPGAGNPRGVPGGAGAGGFLINTLPGGNSVRRQISGFGAFFGAMREILGKKKSGFLEFRRANSGFLPAIS